MLEPEDQTRAAKRLEAEGERNVIKGLEKDGTTLRLQSTILTSRSRKLTCVELTPLHSTIKCPALFFISMTKLKRSGGEV